MTDALDDSSARLQKSLQAGDANALAQAFSQYEQQLKKIIRFRIDRRLNARLSDSDVLQETYVSAIRRLDHYAKTPDLSPFMWLRLLVKQQLADLVRRHLLAEKRDARKELAFLDSPRDETAFSIAQELAAEVTAVSQVVVRNEMLEQLEQSLSKMDPIDREVIALRHFEELTNSQTAQVLKIEKSAASKRYIRAMKKLAQLMQEVTNEVAPDH